MSHSLMIRLDALLHWAVLALSVLSLGCGCDGSPEGSEEQACREVSSPRPLSSGDACEMVPDRAGHTMEHFDLESEDGFEFMVNSGHFQGTTSFRVDARGRATSIYPFEVQIEPDNWRREWRECRYPLGPTEREALKSVLVEERFAELARHYIVAAPPDAMVSTYSLTVGGRQKLVTSNLGFLRIRRVHSALEQIQRAHTQDCLEQFTVITEAEAARRRRLPTR